MNNAGKIKQLIKDIANNKTCSLFIARIIKTEGDTCSIDVDGFEITDVRLRAVLSEEQDTILITPKTDSQVLVADLSKGNMHDLVVVQYSEVEEIHIKAGETELKIDKNGYQLDKGSENLKTILSAFMDEVMKIFVVQGTSPNVSVLTELKQKLETILK